MRILPPARAFAAWPRIFLCAMGAQQRPYGGGTSSPPPRSASARILASLFARHAAHSLPWGRPADRGRPAVLDAAAKAPVATGEGGDSFAPGGERSPRPSGVVVSPWMAAATIVDGRADGTDLLCSRRRRLAAQRRHGVCGRAPRSAVDTPAPPPGGGGEGGVRGGGAAGCGAPPVGTIRDTAGASAAALASPLATSTSAIKCIVVTETPKVTTALFDPTWATHAHGATVADAVAEGVATIARMADAAAKWSVRVPGVTA